MIKFVLYLDKDENALIFKKYFNGKTRAINGLTEFNQIVSKFISRDFSVTIDGENMLLSRDNVTFEIQGFKDYIDCHYLTVLKKKIDEIKAKKGIIFKLDKKEVHQRAEKSKRHIFRRVSVGIVTALATIYLLSGVTTSYESSVISSESIISKPAYVALVKEEPESRSIQDEVFIHSSAVNYSLPEPCKSIFEEKTMETSEISEVEAEVQEETREEKYDNLIRTYSNYFLFDAEKVIKLARDLTDNYTIDFSEVNDNTSYRLDNMEAQVMVFCHELNRDNLVFPLSDLGYNVEYFKSGRGRVTLSTQVEAMGYTIEEFQDLNRPNNLHENFVLSGEYSYSQFVGKICDLLNMDKSYSLAISYLESDCVGSNIALMKNNFGGQRGKDGFFTYDTPEAGVIAFLRNLKRYEGFDLSSIGELSGMYVNGNSSVPAPTWIGNVEGFHFQISTESEKYFLDTSETLVLGEETQEKDKVLTLTETH